MKVLREKDRGPLRKREHSIGSVFWEKLDKHIKYYYLLFFLKNLSLVPSHNMLQQSCCEILFTNEGSKVIMFFLSPHSPLWPPGHNHTDFHIQEHKRAKEQTLTDSLPPSHITSVYLPEKQALNMVRAKVKPNSHPKKLSLKSKSKIKMVVRCRPICKRDCRKNSQHYTETSDCAYVNAKQYSIYNPC